MELGIYTFAETTPESGGRFGAVSSPAVVRGTASVKTKRRGRGEAPPTVEAAGGAHDLARIGY